MEVAHFPLDIVKKLRRCAASPGFLALSSEKCPTFILETLLFHNYLCQEKRKMLRPYPQL